MYDPIMRVESTKDGDLVAYLRSISILVGQVTVGNDRVHGVELLSVCWVWRLGLAVGFGGW
eukprot:2066925-Prymnesium_polylepis.1